MSSQSGAHHPLTTSAWLLQRYSVAVWHRPAVTGLRAMYAAAVQSCASFSIVTES